MIIERVLLSAALSAAPALTTCSIPSPEHPKSQPQKPPSAPVEAVHAGPAPHPEDRTTRAVGPLYVGRMQRTKEQAVRLARWCVVEDACVLWPVGTGSPKHPRCGTGSELSHDCKAIIEVAVNNLKQSHESWDDALAFVSPRMMGDKEPKSVRSAWIKELSADSSGPPASWRDCRDQDPCDGDWRLYKERWAKFRDNVISYWIDGPLDVCEGRPLAEGMVADAIRIAIPVRGFEQYECEGVERLWIGGPPLRPRTISAKVASEGY